jgi:hypothetical protein
VDFAQTPDAAGTAFCYLFLGTEFCFERRVGEPAALNEVGALRVIDFHC